MLGECVELNINNVEVLWSCILIYFRICVVNPRNFKLKK